MGSYAYFLGVGNSLGIEEDICYDRLKHHGVLPTLKELVEELSCDTHSGMGMFGFLITSIASVVGPRVKFEKMT